MAIYAPFILSTPVTFELKIPSVEAFASRIGEISAKYPWLVAEKDGVILGYAYGSPHRSRAAYQWSVEVSAYLAPEARRQGVGTALYDRLFAELRELGYVNAYSGVVIPNEASTAFHQALGFTLVGIYHRIGYKLGRWHDTAWYELRLSEPAGTPPNLKR